MLKINELNSYLKNKGVPEGIYSILKEGGELKNIVTKMNIWQFYIL